MPHGRVFIGASQVGSFTIDDEERLLFVIDGDITIRLSAKDVLTIKVGDNPTTVLKKVSAHGLVVGLNFEPEFDKDDHRFGPTHKTTIDYDTADSIRYAESKRKKNP